MPPTSRGIGVLERDDELDAARETIQGLAFDFEQGDGEDVIWAALEAFDAKRAEVRREVETLDLLGRFQLIQDGAVHSQHVDTEAKALLARWDEPHRRYHTRKHLIWCLEELDRYMHHARDWKAIALAFWCHDAIYDVHAPAGKNEVDSSRLCVDVGLRLGWPLASIQCAARMVMLTASPAVRYFVQDVANFDEALMIDIDLAIFSATPAGYDEYERQIREEYAHVPEADFRRARARILRELGGERFTYRTGPFLLRNDAARDNLALAIARLEAG